MKYINFIFLLLLLSTQVYGASKEDFIWSGNLYKNIKQFNEIHDAFSKKVCVPGTEFKYKKLLKNYRGQGNFLPLLQDDIDRDAISSNLHYFKKKIAHIDQILKQLKKDKTTANFKIISQDINDTIRSLLQHKKNYQIEVDPKKKALLIASSNKLLKLLNKQYTTMVNSFYFLKSFNYPNDHLKNRFDYEKFKDSDKIADQKEANRIFFYRKIVEDGTYNDKHQRSDLFTRSTLDTLYYELQSQKDFLSENARYDLTWVFKNVELLLSEGYKSHISRLLEWKKRAEDSYKFYQEIISEKNKAKAHALVREKNEATFALKEFVYKKQAETYEFWQKQELLWTKLYVLETILYNEVGVIDGPDALDRYDVAQVVMNRYLDSFYSTLNSKQELLSLIKLGPEMTKQERWLNTLFKTGEFSFTYHYIGGVLEIFCPDKSRRGRKIRDFNLKVIMRSLKSFNEDFKAVRYFSRVSMLGKIDMSSVWSDFEKVPEKPGLEAENQRSLERLFHADKYEFLYNFQDPKNITYQVVKISDKIFAMTWIRGRPRFYKYRDPHLFTYFRKK